MRAPEYVMRNIRATRASPPARATDDPHRRAIYGAGLEQFEQLLRAAEVVGPAARPLPLFYALSQAGRAIVAARGEDPDIDAHGLSEDRESPAPRDLLHRRVKRSPGKAGRDAFGAVSRTIGSADLSGSVHLGAVWAALPETYRIPSDSWLPEWRPAVDVTNDIRANSGEGRVHAWSLMGNPHLDGAATLKGRYPSIRPTRSSD
jgi:hypothetical protein